MASANGGLSFESDEQGAAGELMVGLRAAAYAELARLGNVDLQTEDGTYRVPPWKNSWRLLTAPIPRPRRCPGADRGGRLVSPA